MSVLMIYLMVYTVGCHRSNASKETQSTAAQQNKTGYQDTSQEEIPNFMKDESKKCEVVSQVKTAQKDVVLTFEGMGDKNALLAILDELDKYGIKAMFFLPGMRVAEEPDIAQEILRRGHEIGNNTLNRADVTKLDYESIYKEIKLSHDVIVEKTRTSPKYLRTRSGNYNDDVRCAAAQCGYQAVVTYSINPQDWDMKSAGEIAKIVEDRLAKGSVIILNTDKNTEVVKAIPLIAGIVKEAGYRFVPLEQMIKGRLPEVDIIKAGSDRAEIISYAYTTKPQLALTFNGTGSENTIESILDELDKYALKATFFLPGERVAENPTIALEILRRGHRIQNGAFSKADLTSLTYDEVYREIKLSHDIILQKTGVSAKYLRPSSGKFKDDVLAAASQCGYDDVVTYTIYPRSWNLEDAEAAEKILRQLSRGRIIMLNADSADVVKEISMVVKMTSKAGLKLVTLEELLEGQYKRLPSEKIPGYYAAKVNADYEKTEYQKIRAGQGDKKQVAITFDDWANDFYLSKILEVLRKYGVKSTFFLRGSGVESNPNLARLILEEGHEVANHTYNHKAVTGISPEEVQKEVVRCHQVLSEALGQSPKLYFRPPTGTIDDLSAKAVAASGYKTIVMYDVSPQDWKAEESVNSIVKDVIENTGPGSNIVLHLQDDMKTALALDTIIKELKDEGYELVTVSELIN